MKKHAVPVLMAASALLAGCADMPYPERPASFGYAVNAAKQAQMLNPQGTGRDPANVSGVDGRAAKESMDRYVDSFKAPPKTTNVFNIGGAVTDAK